MRSQSPVLFPFRSSAGRFSPLHDSQRSSPLSRNSPNSSSSSISYTTGSQGQWITRVHGTLWLSGVLPVQFSHYCRNTFLLLHQSPASFLIFIFPFSLDLDSLKEMTV